MTFVLERKYKIEYDAGARNIIFHTRTNGNVFFIRNFVFGDVTQSQFEHKIKESDYHGGDSNILENVARKWTAAHSDYA